MIIVSTVLVRDTGNRRAVSVPPAAWPSTGLRLRNTIGQQATMPSTSRGRETLLGCRKNSQGGIDSIYQKSIDISRRYSMPAGDHVSLIRVT